MLADVTHKAEVLVHWHSLFATILPFQSDQVSTLCRDHVPMLAVVTQKVKFSVH